MTLAFYYWTFFLFNYIWQDSIITLSNDQNYRDLDSLFSFVCTCLILVPTQNKTSKNQPSKQKQANFKIQKQQFFCARKLYKKARIIYLCLFLFKISFFKKYWASLNNLIYYATESWYSIRNILRHKQRSFKS